MGNFCLFVGNVCPFVGNVCPFVGNVCPFVGNFCPCVGNVCPCVGNFCPFVGNVCLFVGNFCPFVGNFSPFMGNSGPCVGRFIGMNGLEDRVIGPQLRNRRPREFGRPQAAPTAHRSYAFAAMFVTLPLRSPITQLPWKIAPSSMISAGVSMSL